MVFMIHLQSSGKVYFIYQNTPPLLRKTFHEFDFNPIVTNIIFKKKTLIFFNCYFY